MEDAASASVHFGAIPVSRQGPSNSDFPSCSDVSGLVEPVRNLANRIFPGEMSEVLLTTDASDMDGKLAQGR